MNTKPLRTLLAILGLVTIGCQGAPPPSAAPAALTSDEEVLQKLDYLEPMYQVNAEGRVIRLRLVNKHLPPDVMEEVGKLTELQNLDAYGTTLTDEGLAHLKDLQNLSSFGLGGTLITDQGLVHLQKLRGLHHVWLPKRTISQGAVDSLKNARPDLNTYLQ